MKCVKCGKQKGKRACPALGGDICSACCGTHRLKEISCPADCTWLGGLAVVAGLSEPPPEDVRAVIQEVCASVGPWIRTYPHRQHFFDIAAGEVFGDDDPTEGNNDWLVELWAGGLEHGAVDEKGRRLVDIMLAERARVMPPAHVAALRSLSRSWFSAFRVERVDVDKGVLLRDTIDEREIYVHEKSGTHYMKPLDVVLAFISTTGGVEMFQGIVQVPPAHTLQVIDKLRALMETAGAVDRIAATPLVWGETLGTLRTLVRDWRPVMQNTDGDSLFPSKARFDVVDEDALRRALSSSADLEADKDGNGWGWRRGKGDGALSLGHLGLDRRGLVLEVNSRERLERGKAMLTALAGVAVKHRIDEHMDMDRMLDDARGKQPREPAADGIPEDVKRKVIGQALQRMYKNVLDEPVPALGGKTPRRAAQDGAEGKRRVREWLDGLEQSLHSMPGATEAIDVDKWRTELGIEPRHGGDDDDDDDRADEGGPNESSRT